MAIQNKIGRFLYERQRRFRVSTTLTFFMVVSAIFHARLVMRFHLVSPSGLVLSLLRTGGILERLKRMLPGGHL